MRDIFRDEIAEWLSRQTGMPVEEVENLISRPPDASMGQYAFPCFLPAKRMGRNPKDLAAELAKAFEASELIEEAKDLGPYLNFFVQPQAFVRHVIETALAEGANYGGSKEGKGKTVVVDLSSPNIAKHLGVHHLRSTMIGHALRNIYEALGYRVVAVNHLGDWGTQFGQLIAAYKRYGSPEMLKEDAVTNLNKLYVRFHAEAEKNEAMFEEGRSWFSKLEKGDKEATELWERFRDVSLVEFERIYSILGVTFDSYAGESFYNDKLDAAVERLKEKGLAKVSEEALIVDLSEYDMPPCLLRKRDEASLYATRDICAAEYRREEYDFDKMLYVVGADQRLYFRQLFKVLELMGYEWAKNCAHVDFGLIRFDTSKMSTRRGATILLEDVLDEAIRRAKKIIEEKNPDLADKDQVAKDVGVGAVVFGDLASKRVKDVDFDWDRMISFEGETGPYVQYVHVRLCGILRKFAKPVPEQTDLTLLQEPEELALAGHILDFGAQLRRAAEANEPSVICNYMLKLCSEFNGYYHEHRIVGDDPALTAARVQLVHCLKQTIAKGLGLLGIAAPANM